MRNGNWVIRKGVKIDNSIKLILEDLDSGECVSDSFMRMVEFLNSDGTYCRQHCPKCGKQMYEVWDSIARGYTGYNWKCKCFPKKLVLSIG